MWTIPKTSTHAVEVLLKANVPTDYTEKFEIAIYNEVTEETIFSEITTSTSFVCFLISVAISSVLPSILGSL